MWCPKQFSCVFGKAIGNQLWWSWHGLSPAAAQMNWNADYTFRLQRRKSYLAALFYHGGNVLITIGGFCLAGTIFFFFNII